MAKENAVMGRIGLIYNHDRSIECRIQCTGCSLTITGKYPEVNCLNSWIEANISYHPEVKKYKKALKKIL